MRKPVDNLFTFYRGPSSRNGADYRPGKQLEDNATKSLLNVLEQSNTGVANTVVTRLLTEIGWEGSTPDPEDEFEFRTQQALSEIDAAKEIYLLGLSKSGKDPFDEPVAEQGESIAGPEEIGQNVDQDESGRLDAVISTEEIILVIESKFNWEELREGQLGTYLRTPGFSGERYGAVSWRDVYRALGESLNTELDPLSAGLIAQYREFLEYWVLEFELTTSRFKDGYNQVKLVRNVEPNRKTKKIETDNPQLILQFRTRYDDDDGTPGSPRVQFTQAEWQALLRRFDEHVVTVGEKEYSLLTLLRGEGKDSAKKSVECAWNYLAKFRNPDKKWNNIAKIGQEGEVRKLIRIDRKESDPEELLLVFQTATKNDAWLNGAIPMLDQTEFRELFVKGSDSTNTTDHPERLLDPEVEFMDLFQ